MIPTPPKGFCWPRENTNAFVSEAMSAIDNPSKASGFLRELGVIDRGHPNPERMHRAIPLYTVRDWKRGGLRTVFVSDDAMRACANTDVLDCVRPSDLMPPYPAWLFWFQKPINNLVSGAIISTNDSDKCLMFLFLRCDDYAWSAEYFRFGEDSLRDHLDGAHQSATDRTIPDTILSAARAATECALNLILLMQSYPQYVTVEQVKHKMRGGKAKIIDAQRITLPSSLRQQIKVSTEIDAWKHDAFGKSPKAHWRRGHWRRQPHGQQWADANPEVKPVVDHMGRQCHMVWIHPLLIAAGDPQLV